MCTHVHTHTRARPRTRANTCAYRPALYVIKCTGHVGRSSQYFLSSAHFTLEQRSWRRRPTETHQCQYNHTCGSFHRFNFGGRQNWHVDSRRHVWSESGFPQALYTLNKNSLILTVVEKRWQGIEKIKIHTIKICCGTLSKGLLLKFAIHDFLVSVKKNHSSAKKE